MDQCGNPSFVVIGWLAAELRVTEIIGIVMELVFDYWRSAAGVLGVVNDVGVCRTGLCLRVFVADAGTGVRLGTRCYYVG